LIYQLYLYHKMKISENLNDILFYTLENTVKSYRQYAQRIITANGFNITIDQWLLLKTILENPEQTQHQIAETIFKDHASVTRMIELLVQKKYLERNAYLNDRRRFKVTVSQEATDMLKSIQPLIEQNRSVALAGISQDQSKELRQILHTIINNCKS